MRDEQKRSTGLKRILEVTLPHLSVFQSSLKIKLTKKKIRHEGGDVQKICLSVLLKSALNSEYF